MKVTAVKVLSADRFNYVKVETDEGVTGYGECSEPRSPHGVLGTIADMKPLLMGKDPRQYEMRFWDMLRGTRQSPGGIAAKAIAGVELALLDIKAKALGISVVELFGGPMRDTVRLYWSHCGTIRAMASDLIGTPPIRTMSRVRGIWVCIGASPDGVIPLALLARRPVRVHGVTRHPARAANRSAPPDPSGSRRKNRRLSSKRWISMHSVLP